MRASTPQIVIAPNSCPDIFTLDSTICGFGIELQITKIAGYTNVRRETTTVENPKKFETANAVSADEILATKKISFSEIDLFLYAQMTGYKVKLPYMNRYVNNPTSPVVAR
jgi:hypothetical protein